MMEFMREHRKALLIVFVVIFAVCFGLPSYMGNQRNQVDREIGSFAGADGTKVIYTSQDLGYAAVQLKSMLELQIPQLLLQGAMYDESLALINPIATNLACNAVFGDARTSYMTRSYLMDATRYLSADAQEVEATYAKIVRLIDGTRQGSENFLILSAEAHRNGYYATQKQIDFITDIARMQVNQGGMKLSNILANAGMTLSNFQEGISNLISIILYADQITKVGGVNENEIRSRVRDNVEVDRLSGSYVEFSSSLFRDKVSDPDEAEIVAHFEKYKAIDPMNIKADDESNKFGFSYMLPDRLQVEFLDINVSAISKARQDEFAAKPATEQEEILQKYWSEHKSEQDYQTMSRPTDGSEPVMQQRTFDESYSVLKRNYINSLALEEGRKLMADIRDSVRNTNELLQANIDWQEVAEKLGDNVSRNVTEYLSYESLNSFERFGVAKATLMNNAPLGQVLFSSEPMRDQPASKLDAEPLKLREPLLFVEAGYGTNISNLYAVRIIGFDKSRQAVSIDDDGRQGSAQVTPLTDGKNVLKDQIKTDLRNVKSFEMALASAREFQALAKDGWDAAIETVGNNLKSEGDSGNPLASRSLESLYTQLESIRQRMQQDQQNAQRYQGSLNYYYKTLNAVMAAYRKAQSNEFLLAQSESEYTVRVFDKLEVTPANQDDLAKNKGRIAIQLQQRSQFQPLLDMFIQENIDARNGFESLVQDEMEDETETKVETQAATETEVKAEVETVE